MLTCWVGFTMMALVGSVSAQSRIFEVGGLHLELWEGAFTVKTLNMSVPHQGTWGKANNFSFVPHVNAPRNGCHNLGDLTIRVQPASSTDTATWAYYSSASASHGQTAPTITHGPGVLAAHDLTQLMNQTNSAQQGVPNPYFDNSSPLAVTRSYEEHPSGLGFVMRFNVTNTLKQAIRIGGLGASLPTADMQPGIEESVWHDPHIGADHGWVEWVRVVVDEQVLLAVPNANAADKQKRLGDGGGTLASSFEAWRAILENTCGNSAYSFEFHSKAWATEWKESKQWPYLHMAKGLNDTKMWPNPKSPWPAWHGHDTVPATNPQPWNEPTFRVLQANEAISFSLHILPAPEGPRTRDAALAAAGKAVVHAVPGYVLSNEMKVSRLFVLPPKGTTVKAVSASDESLLTVQGFSVQAFGGHTEIRLKVPSAESRGRCRLSVTFSDNTVMSVHYNIVPSFAEQIRRVGQHWAQDAWLPREFVDPFGRSASVMPWDRETKQHVLDDSRAYNVGLSDDSGGGNPLGFAMKVAYSPQQDEVTRVDDYIKWTLYGIKEDTASPPYKSLQIRYNEPGYENNADQIRMTMYYYNASSKPISDTSSGHFPYNYTEADKCGLPGIEGGPNWCMSEGLSNATYRVFNMPHHTASYYAMYRTARNHEHLNTHQSWDWYLARAANTTIRFGSPSVGVMDGTVFREVLRSLEEEASMSGSDPQWTTYAQKISANMYSRAAGFNEKEYPYGSEFAFDTTGQEEVVVWLMHFANATNDFSAAAKRTVDMTLSHMRSSPTFAYHGGSRSWGDVGNNGKWMPSTFTSSNFEVRGNFHYRAGLNMIPLLEWYRSNPDDFLLLEISMGTQTGQLTGIDENGAPSMMMHMLPHVLDFDPHSGDFGLGFFGHTLEAGAYFVEHKALGPICFQCDALVLNKTVTIIPTDSYKQRIFIEPLAAYIRLDTGNFESLQINMKTKQIKASFVQTGTDTFSTRRIYVEKTSSLRPGADFQILKPNSAPKHRGAFEVTASTTSVVISWV